MGRLMVLLNEIWRKNVTTYAHLAIYGHVDKRIIATRETVINRNGDSAWQKQNVTLTPLVPGLPGTLQFAAEIINVIEGVASQSIDSLCPGVSQCFHQ
jgi:hypothetical protein